MTVYILCEIIHVFVCDEELFLPPVFTVGSQIHFD